MVSKGKSLTGDMSVDGKVLARSFGIYTNRIFIFQWDETW